MIKISIEPGQYFNNFLLDRSIKKRKDIRTLMIFASTDINDQLVDIPLI